MSSQRTRERLLDSAERLFAEHGFDGVSLRAINAAAGANAASVHYHFGSRERLVEALLVRRMAGIRARRRELLDRLEAQPDRPRVRDAVEALIRPLAELRHEVGEPGRLYLRLLARLFSDRPELVREVVMTHFADEMLRIDRLLQRARPQSDVERLRLGLQLAIEAGVHALASATGQGAKPDFAEILIDFIAGGIDAAADPGDRT